MSSSYAGGMGPEDEAHAREIEDLLGTGREGELGDRDGRGRGQRRPRKAAQWKATVSNIAERLMRLPQEASNVASAASSAAVFVGYCIGISSSAFLYFERTSSSKVLGKEYFLATLHLSASIGSILAGWSADMFGRRSSLVAASLLGILGAILSSISPSTPVLLAAQALTGLALGYCLVLCPLYISEMCPASHRGMLMCYPELGVSFGLACAYVSTFLCGSNWRRMLALGAAPAAALGGAALLLLPESPRWLALTGQVREAVQSLVAVEEREDQAASTLEDILSGLGNTENTPLLMMQAGLDTTNPSPSGMPVPGGHSHIHGVHGGHSVLLGRGNRGGGVVSVSALVSRASKASVPWRDLVTTHVPESTTALMVLVLGLGFYQQAIGMDASLSYLPELLAVAGISSTGAEFAAGLGVAVSRGLAALLCGALVDEAGRRPLLLISCAGSMLALLVQATVLQVLSMGQTLADDAEESLASFAPHQNAGAAVFAIITVCNFAAFFSLGLGPTIPLIDVESCPLKLRAMATGISTAFNRLIVAVLVFCLVSLADATSVSVPFVIFALMAAVSLGFLSHSVRDMTGRSLEAATQAGTGGHSSLVGDDLPVSSSSLEWGSSVAKRSRGAASGSVSPL